MSAAPFTRAVLRDGQFANILGRVSVAPFTLEGRTFSGVLELWREDGRWREDGNKHGLDIIQVVTPAGLAISMDAEVSP